MKQQPLRAVDAGLAIDFACVGFDAFSVHAAMNAEVWSVEVVMGTLCRPSRRFGGCGAGHGGMIARFIYTIKDIALKRFAVIGLCRRRFSSIIWF
jgi:hypothetical protein